VSFMVRGGVMLADDVVKALRSRPVPPDGFSEEHWDTVMRNIFKQHVYSRVFGGSEITNFKKNLGFICKTIGIKCDLDVVTQILDEYLCEDIHIMTLKYLGESFEDFDLLAVKLQDSIMRGEIL